MPGKLRQMEVVLWQFYGGRISNIWDERYAMGGGYLFGTQLNAFLLSHRLC
jgi:hypothetical protein